MSCDCACHASSGSFKLRCTRDKGSSGVPGLPSCWPCDADQPIGRTPKVASDGRVQEPCVYPGCDEPFEVDGQIMHEPRLTFNTICRGCRRRYWKLLGWLLEDYVTIKYGMPRPAQRPGDGSKHMSPKAKSFGHPAEWPSDRAALIADQLNELEHDLREHLDDGAAVHPRVDEIHRMKLAYDYLTRHNNFDALCRHPAAGDYAENLNQIHNENRSRLGLTRFAQKLPVPCPSCDVAALVRSVGQVECQSCHRVIQEDQYPFLVRMVLDDLIEAYDKKEAMA